MGVIDLALTLGMTSANVGVVEDMLANFMRDDNQNNNKESQNNAFKKRRITEGSRRK